MRNDFCYVLDEIVSNCTIHENELSVEVIKGMCDKQIKKNSKKKVVNMHLLIFQRHSYVMCLARNRSDITLVE